MHRSRAATAAGSSPTGRARRLVRNRYLWAALVLSALTVVFFGPVFRFGGSYSAVYAHQRTNYPWVKPADPVVFSLHDQADYVYPHQVFLDRSLKRDHQIPLWDPLTFAGHPFFAETGSRIAYPPFLLLTLLFSPILTHDVYLMLHVAGAGLAMFGLLRELRTRFAGALLAGVAWAFSSYGLLYYSLEMYAAVAALLPLVLLCVHRWHDRRSWPALLTGSLLLGLLYLGTSAELALLAYLVAAAYAGCLALNRLVRERATLQPGQVAGLLAAPVVFVGAAAAVAAVGILPFVDLSARSGRVPLAYADIQRYFPHLGLADFARAFLPPHTPLSASALSQQVFVGTATALLAVIGFATRRAGAALGRALLIVVVVVAVGGPGTWLAYHLPGINKLHGVGRAFFLFDLGLALLAGFGLDRLANGPPSAQGVPPTPAARRRRAAGVTALGALCAATAFLQLFTYGRGIAPPFQPRSPAFLLPPTPATEAARAVLAATPGGGRVLPIIRQGVDPGLGTILPAGTAMALDLPVTGGYEPVLPEQVAMMWRALTGERLGSVLTTKLNDTALNAGTVGDLARVDLFPRFGVSAVLGPPTMPEQPGWSRDEAARRGLKLVYTGPDGVVYEVVNRNPRAFVVHQATVATTPADALVELERPSFDVRREVILGSGDGASTSAAPAAPAGGSQVRWLDDRPNGVKLAVDSPAAGWLVLLDSWDPGWRATVDGRAAPVLRADFGFRAVRIPAGSSTVRLSYRPAPVFVGAAISAVTTVAILAFLLGATIARRRRRHLPESEAAADAGPAPAARLRGLVSSDTGRKFIRYGVASVVNVVIGEAILALAFGWLHWSARSAAVLAAVLAAGPAYWLARRWVWGRSGRSHLVREVLPFWGLALAGLALTTWAAGVGEALGVDAGLGRPGQTALVMAAVLAASAAFWVVRFVLLNRVLFADRPAAGLQATRR